MSSGCPNRNFLDGVLTQAGGELDSTGQLKGKWRAVVGQQATLKADQKNLLAKPSFAMAV